jgi:hypothetical protein
MKNNRLYPNPLKDLSSRSSNLPAKSFLPLISGIYSAALDVTVFLSGALFLSFFITQLLKIKNDYFFFFLIWTPLFLQSFYRLKKLKGSKTLSKFGQQLIKIIKFLGSVIFLFLFVNYYLINISGSFNLKFLKEKIEWESFFNSLIFSIVISMTFLTILLEVGNFITKKEGRKRKVFIVILILILLFLIIKRSPPSWIIFIYPKWNLIFGFSLFYLHSNYLLQEIFRLLKFSKGNKNREASI